MILWTVVVIVFARTYLIWRCRLKAHVLYTYVDDNIAWDDHATVIYPDLYVQPPDSSRTGSAWGGIVTGPLMLAMGVHPKVSSTGYG